MTPHHYHLRRPGALLLLLCISALWLAAFPARAAEATATAALSDSQAEVGQSVDFTITVNASEARVPENIDVDGLSVTYTGVNTQTQISIGNLFGSNSHSETSTIYTYSVVPQHAGRFVIPSQTVEVNGERVTTRPVNLTVGGASGGAAGSAEDSAPAQSGANAPLYFAQLVIPKTNVYIGEAVPMEARIYVDARIAQQMAGPPEVPAEACTMQPMTKPTRTETDRDGRQFIVYTVKTALTAAKAGQLKIGPVSADFLMQIPQKRPHHSGGFNNPFDNPFFDDAFRMMGPTQQVTVKGDAVTLDVKPLPAAGQPKSFAGAVGQYTLSTSVKPTEISAGDPITLTAKIEGRGNFDRVTAPQLTDSQGWRAYPPSAKFTQDDDIGVSGAKTFDTAIIPSPEKTASPAVQWSYFDPEKERYFTLTGSPVPIKIEGQTAATPAPASPFLAQRVTPVAAPAPTAPDILYIRADSSGWGRTFAPLYENRTFWTVQAAPLLALLGFVFFRIRGIRAADLQALERAQWRREKDAAVAALRRRDTPERELYQAATQALCLDAAIQTGRPAATLHAAEVLACRELNPATAERIRHLFERQAEALYAGTSSGGIKAAAPETQADTLDLLQKYESAKVIA